MQQKGGQSDQWSEGRPTWSRAKLLQASCLR
jgi:hypothetical protein